MTRTNVVSTMDEWDDEFHGDHDDNPQITYTECWACSDAEFVGSSGNEAGSTTFAYKHQWKIRMSSEAYEKYGNEASFEVRLRWKAQASASSVLDFAASDSTQPYLRNLAELVSALESPNTATIITSDSIGNVGAEAICEGVTPAREIVAYTDSYQYWEWLYDGDINEIPNACFIEISNAAWTYQGVNTVGYVQFNYVNGEYIGYAEFNDLGQHVSATLSATLSSQEVGLAHAAGIIRKEFRLVKVGELDLDDWD